MESRSRELEYDNEQHISTKPGDDSGLSLLQIVRTVVAGTAVGGPLLVGMGITLAVTVSVGIIGIPLLVIFSPLLILPCFILVTAIAGFSIAALLALAGITTLNWVFRSIRHQYSTSYDVVTGKDDQSEEEEEDTAAKTLASRGWKREHEPEQKHRQLETVGEQEQQQHQQETVGEEEQEKKYHQQETVGKEVEEEEQEKKHHQVETVGKEAEQEKEEEEEQEQENKEDVTTTPPQTDKPAPASTTAAAPDTSQKIQPPQKSKKQRPKK